MGQTELPNGTGYESYRTAVLSRQISGGEKIQVTNEDDITFNYIALTDGRLKVPAVCYDNADETEKILGKKARWEVVPANSQRSTLIAGFGLSKLLRR